MSAITELLSNGTQQLTSSGAPFEIENRCIDQINYRLYKHAPATLAELLDAGRKHGDAEFVIYEGERWSFNTFYRQVDQLAHILVDQFSIKPGERIAIAMRNYPEWMSAFVAAASIGAVVVPLNSWGQAQELEYGLTDSGARLVFCDQARMEALMHFAAANDVQLIVARCQQDVRIGNTCHRMEQLLAELDPKLPLSKAEPDLNSEDPALIMYTSGTTGKPKGALSCHRNITQAIVNFEFAGMLAAMTNADIIADMLGKGFPPKQLLAVPLFHVSGCHSVFMTALRAGRSLVIMYKWDADQALSLIENERITMLNAVPAMLWELMDSPNWDHYDTSSLFGFGAGGSAQPPGLPGLARQKLPMGFPGTGYGMTESNASGFSSTGNAYNHKPLSAGTISPLFDVKFCAEDGTELPRGETGEIWLRSPTIVQGYWNKPDATEQSFSTGWFRTGDIGYMDDEGYLFLTDRVKDMIIRAGENIYSAEIEAILYQLPEIREAAAFGLPHETLGEELAVAIVLKPGCELNEQQIRDHVAARLAGFKVPGKVYLRQQALPKNASMKVLKKQLKDECMAQQ